MLNGDKLLKSGLETVWYGDERWWTVVSRWPEKGNRMVKVTGQNHYFYSIEFKDLKKKKSTKDTLRPLHHEKSVLDLNACKQPFNTVIPFVFEAWTCFRKRFEFSMNVSDNSTFPTDPPTVFIPILIDLAEKF